MRKTSQQQRQHIIDATDTLLYQKGFHHMSFSDIAQAAGLSKGNLYYYFKTKEEVLSSVISNRVEKVKQMLELWDKEIQHPLDRLKRYAQVPVIEIENVLQYGCPMGSLNTELAKSQPELQKITRQQFDVFKEWIKKQFQVLSPDKDAEELSVHLLVLLQGISIVSQTYADRAIITREVDKVLSWLEELARGAD